MAPAATITFKRLASLIAAKQQQDYNKTIAWIRCLLSFSLVRSSVMCLRGARSSYHRPTKPDFDTPLDVALSDSKAPIKSHRVLDITVSGLLAVLPLLYLVVIFGHWICSRTGAGQRLVQGIKSQIERVCRQAHGTRIEESLPDRLINLRVYDDDGFSDQPYMGIHSGETTTTL